MVEVIVNTGRGSATETRLKNVLKDGNFHYREDQNPIFGSLFLLGYLTTAFSLFKSIRESNSDKTVVLSKGNLISFFLAIMLKFTRYRVILDNDDYEPAISREYYTSGEQGLISHLLTYPAYFITPFLCNHMVVVSEHVEEKFLKVGYSEEKITIIRNGASDCFFSNYSDSAVQELREEFGLEDSKIFGYLGTLKPQSSLMKFIPVFQQISESEDVKLVIVGDGSLRSDLEKQVKSCDISEKVIFTGMIDYSDVPDYLQIFDIAVLPLEDNEHNRGRCSVKMFEYMAAGLPIIADSVGEVKNVLPEKYRVEEDWQSSCLELIGDIPESPTYPYEDYSWGVRAEEYSKVLRSK